ncbi:MAG: ribosome biogenesis GTP-binding protein YihA/YsxC [Desulfobacteraceae bacterium]|nr:ribosome biogenesis GTP-binding protein YihA/YsxC [Desulfobacteraceae bacterium]
MTFNHITSIDFVTSAYKTSGFPEGSHPEIAFAGRSNVGKSSLINALLSRRSLVKVSSRPGLTQSINFFLVNKNIFFVDLPGYGFAKAPKEVTAKWKTLIEGYFQTKRDLRSVVCIFDIRRLPDQMDAGLLEYLHNLKINTLIALNKADKLSQPKRAAQVKAITSLLPHLAAEPFLVSARTGEGIMMVMGRLMRSIQP